MFYFYQYGEQILFSQTPLSDFQQITEDAAMQAAELTYLSHRSGFGKTIFCINHPGYFAEEQEGLWCLDTKQLQQLAKDVKTIPQWLASLAAAGKIRGVCAEQAQIAPLLRQANKDMNRVEKKTVHILALGDVGSTLLIGLAMLGGDCIKEIGIYDFDEKLCQRWEREINQIAYPWQYDQIPTVRVIKTNELFQCDVFIFCASKSIPPVGAEIQDVRMAQLEANSAVISQYGQMARAANYQGLFAVVSDPVDPLCQRVYAASNKNKQGHWDGTGMRPEQVQGYGLGVMNSRAAYYAKQDSRFAQFLTEGRAYGPHGQKLVIANSIANYNHGLSLELTKKTVEANLDVRALGYKPYVAPAISSAAISIVLTMRGQWHYSSNFLGGIYMGAKNRSTPYGVELEHLELPAALLQRLEYVVEELQQLKH